MAAGAVTVARLATLMEMDLAAYRQGLKTAKTEGDAGAKSIAQSFKEAFRKSATGQNFVDFRGLLEQAQRQRVPLRELFAGLALDAGRDLRSAFTSGIRAGGERGLSFLRGAFSSFASAGKSVLQGIFQGIGIGIFQAAVRGISDLINAIPDLIQRGREYGIVVDQISDATGASAEASSRLAGTLQFLGAPLGSIVNLLGQMSRNLEENEERLNAAGVATRDNSGALFNQVQILENARQAFNRYGDGTAKAALIAREFGRGGLQVLVDYLKLTDEEAQQVTDDLEAQGLIISESQRRMAETAQREGNRFQNALTGLGQTLFNVVGPQITAFFSDLSNAITEHADDIAAALSNVVSFILGMISALTGINAGLDSFSGSLAAGERVASPYSARLLQLNLELADLDDKQKAATNSTDAQRKAIDRQIQAVEREIEVLRRQEKAQDTVFRRAIAGFARVYQLRLDALALAEREREQLEQQRDLNERLNEAQLALAEAQRGEVQGGQRVVDAEAVADAMERIADIQRDQAENARRIETDQQKASLEATRDYIESIGKLLEEAENKRAALNTLRRRREVLEARLAAQEAAGDTEGATDTRARIEAIQTAEIRAQEQIRNQEKEDSLARQKALLAEEKAAVKATVVDTTAIRRAELEKQIADLEKQNAAWERLTDKQKENLIGVTTALSGEGGLTEAMKDARDAGVEFGESLKTAFENAADALGGLLDGLRWIVNNLNNIGLAFRYINDPNFREQINNAGGVGAGGDLASGVLGVIADLIATLNPFDKSDLQEMIDEARRRRGNEPEFAEGGTVPGPIGRPRTIIAHGGEGIASLSFMDKLNRLYASAQTPALAPSFAGVGGHGHDLYINGEKVGEALMPGIERKLADRRRF